MEEPIEIDVDPPTGFDAILQAALDSETRIPIGILGLIPSTSITASSLLKNDLPALLYPSAANLRPVESCTVNVPTRWTDGELLRAPIPPRRWLSDLETTEEKLAHSHRCYLSPTSHDVQSVPSTAGWGLLVFPYRGRGTKGRMEKSRALDFRPSAGCDGIRGKRVDGENPVGDKNLGSGWSEFLLICGGPRPAPLKRMAGGETPRYPCLIPELSCQWG